MITLKRSTWIGLGLAGLGLLASAWFWPQLPAMMATHFDAHGRANGYQPREVGALLMPAMIVLVALVFRLLPRLSPRGWDLEGFEPTVGILGLVVEAFLLAMHVAMLRAAATGGVLQPGFILLAMGALLALTGNRFGKVRRNFFIGIRTPWTLADEEVWSRTHRLAGKLFVAAGLLTMLAALLPWGLFAMIPLVGLAAVIPAIHSFVLYRALHPDARA